jgi:hypothetical protein
VPETAKVDVSASLGAAFAAALAAKDFERIRDLLRPEIDFRGLTPSRSWDQIEELRHVETDAFADRERVRYRFLVRNPEWLFEVEQQVYIGERDGRIGWMRSVCSGFRPVEAG